MYAIRDKILLLKCDCWKLKIKVEIKVNGQYIKVTTIFVFEFQFFTIFITCITFFYDQSIFDPRPEYCLNFSKKLPQKIVQQLLCRSSINFKHSKRRQSLFQGQIEYVMHTFEMTSLKVCISLRLPMKKRVLACTRSGLINFRLLFAPANCLDIV